MASKTRRGDTQPRAKSSLNPRLAISPGARAAQLTSVSLPIKWQGQSWGTQRGPMRGTGERKGEESAMQTNWEWGWDMGLGEGGKARRIGAGGRVRTCPLQLPPLLFRLQYPVDGPLFQSLVHIHLHT